ncbi:MAG: SO_0444 family Cu/Zn efflux transporter [Fibrobacter sp.]|uniref:SO_0444 family Cu/Zn efflux transporter n=1 Tax=Fibrobacter sp. TaxID=35828 RepID=UPI002A91E124|nr:SO_0444 family Cu/Zn efflux transporter [Fibrobacter sp.]MDY6262809.1 SO_0444 family Cu/Zn efflux transporter [Fibrobacter sp.]
MSVVAEILEKFVWQFITLFSEMAPFLLLGFLLAGILHVWVPNHLYVPKISKPNFKSVLWSALFGIPLPICSCGVIPTSIALRKEGASKGACVSFLISTPATGVDSILATYSLLGGPFAILRPVAAFVTAMLGGLFTNVVTKNEPETGVAVVGEAHEPHHEHEHCDCDGDHCSCSQEGHDEHSKKSFVQKVRETLEYGFVNMIGDVSKWLIIGLLLGALIAAFVPDDFFLFLHEYPLLCMVVVLVLAMPMYTCATGSIPLALVLVEKGITPGAALVLLMAGPATSIASMLVVGKAFGKRTLAAYLTSIAFGALFFGFIVDTFFMDTFLASMLPHASAECHGHGALGVLDYICAGLFALLIVYAKFAHKGCGGHCGCGCENHDCCCECDDDHDHCECEGLGEHYEHHHEHHHEGECHCHGHHHEHEEPVVETYSVLGMNCSHCKACVEKATLRLDGVLSAEADVASKELRVQWHGDDDVDENALKIAVEEAGFEFGGKK